MKILTAFIFFAIIAVANAQDKFQIIQTSNGERLTIESLVERTLPADVVFFGEYHDDSLNHFLQNEYFRLFVQANPKTALSLEMFERDVQAKLDAYLKGEISEEEFLKTSRPWTDYSKFYRTSVELAKQNVLPVVAANIPRKYAAQYAVSGFDAFKNLPPAERNFISRELILEDNDYQKNFFLTMLSSQDKINALTPNQENSIWLFYGAQCIKDETMAESINDFIGKNKNSKVVHYNGDFHSRYFLGTVEKLRNRNKSINIKVISVAYYDKIEDIQFNDSLAKMADFVIYLPNFDREPQQMMRNNHFGENHAINHNINIEITPEISSVAGNDVITFKNPIIRQAALKILNTVKIKNVKAEGADISYEVRKLDDSYNQILITNKSFDKQKFGKAYIKEFNTIEVAYEGIVNFPPSETNMVHRHSHSLGIISGKKGEGIYLPGGSYYPQTDKDMAKFDFQVRLPKEYTIVTSGYATPVLDGSKAVFSGKTSEIDELILVGGEYKSLKKQHDGIEFGIYMLSDNPNAEKFLDESIKYYDTYTALFGKYPYNAFSIVENFFATGFGMPAFTLISNKLTAMPWVLLAPGSLAHEFVHNWWGNSVFTDYNAGNWCEALTTFSTNYYLNIVNGNEAAAKDWRRKALIAIDALPQDKNYPVADFKYQSDTYDAVIGYDKGAFIFHEILKLTGKDIFFASLRSFAEKNTGKRAYWMNIASEFASKTKDTLKELNIRGVLNDWLKSTEVPEISINYNFASAQKINLAIKSSIKRTMSVPVAIHFSDGTVEKRYFIIKDSTNNFEIVIDKDANKLSLDPDIECLRKLRDNEKPYNFSRTLAKNPLVVVPDAGSQDHKIAMEYVARLVESGYNFDVSPQGKLKNSDVESRSLILLGNVKNNKFIQAHSGKLPKGTVLDKNGFNFGRSSVSFEKEIMLANVSHFASKEELCSIIYFDNLSEAKSLDRLIHYRSYSLVLLSNEKPGKPVYQAEIFPEE